MQIRLLFILCLILLVFSNTNAQKKKSPVDIIETGKDFSIRGLSVPMASSIWISGSNGTVGLSIDSGQNYNLFELDKYKYLDFRDIHAFNDSEALIINSGVPTYILKTNNSGQTWKEVYKNESKDFFFDGFDFWDKQHGIAVADPINNRFNFITTHDGGETWQIPDSVFIPDCEKGEAAFAASGTSIICGKNGKTLIGTGGLNSRLFISEDFGIHWHSLQTTMVSGIESTGIFSVAISDLGRIYIIGGNYKDDSIRGATFYFSDDNGKTWQPSSTPPSGYRSCIIKTKSGLLATGTNGTDSSINEGLTWIRIDNNSFNVAATCPDCDLIFLAGAHGKTGVIKNLK